MSHDTLLFYRKKKEDDIVPIQSTSISLTPTEEEDVEFKSGDFKYNVQFIVLILMSIFPIIALPGKYSLSLFAIGMTLVYILDFLGFSKYTLPAFWFTLAMFWGTIYVSHINDIWTSFFNVFVMGHAGIYILSLAIFGCLQSNQFKNWNPKMTILAERCIFGVFPIVCIPGIVKSVIVLNGVHNIHFYLAILLILMFYLFGVRQESSFQTARFGVNKIYIQKSMDAQILACITLFLPIIFYLGIFHANLEKIHHLITLIGLISLPLLFFTVSSETHLWWFFDDHKHNIWRRVLQFFATLGVFTWIEYFIIFDRYAYLLVIPAPWSYVFVTCGLYAFAALILIKNRFFSILFATACATTAAFVVGFPFVLIPFVALAAFTGTSFLYSSNLKEYLVFGLISSGITFWWLKKSFSFLTYEFQFRLLPIEWTVSMEHTTWTISGLCLLCVLTVASSNIPTLFSFFIISTSICLSMLEQILYEQGEGFYPSSLVITTTVLGIILANSLFTKNRIGINATSVLMSIFFAKLGIFLISVRMVMIAAFFTFFAFTRLYLSTNVKPIYGWIYVLFSGATLFTFRNILMRPLIHFIDQNSSETRLMGFILLCWGITILPLSYRFMRHIKLLRRINIFLIVIGAMVSFLQPNMTTSEWIPWMIIALVCIVIMNVLDIIILPQNIITLFLYFTFIGVGSGLAFCGSFVHEFHTRILVTVTFLLASYVLLLAHYPISSGYKPCIAIYSLFVMVSPFSYFTGDQRFEMLSLYTILNIFLVVIIKFKLSGSPLLNAKKMEQGISVPGADELAIVSNVGTGISYTLSIILASLNDPKPQTFILIATLFLLLNRDSKLLKEFQEQNRYIVMILAIQISLLGFFARDLSVLLMDFDANTNEIVKNGVVLLLMIPSHVLLDAFLWKLKRPVIRNVVLAAVACLIGILICSMESIVLFGMTAIIGAVLQMFTASQWSRQISFPL